MLIGIFVGLFHGQMQLHGSTRGVKIPYDHPGGLQIPQFRREGMKGSGRPPNICRPPDAGDIEGGLRGHST
jgi:hypothetical protein